MASQNRLHFPIGRLHTGFRLIAEQTVLLSGGELFHRTDLTRPAQRRLGRAIDSFLELREGDLVVHVAHGVARYRGLELLKNEGRAEEHLKLEFAGRTHVYVPASKVELVQKYVGGTKSRPTLARLGGRTWTRQKEAVERAVTDLAADMLQLQARRAARPGISFARDTEWQEEFDASFPYTETDDQLKTIAAIKENMHAPRPMDRLICGDVGYGKTEVGMRAAFKAVDAGYQVAVLVPTTVLAEQHHRTFTQRMSEFPFQIASLSRFCTRKQQTAIIARLADGSIDIVIGTHRLAQKDVQFRNLGLVIIDEEQRFGVEVKERLKTLREIVDVVTMTATPIPRTLHMSLLGLRDISNLETPPEDRLAVETRVTRFDEDTIRNAVMRELRRGGQIFFVHNRVHRTFESVADANFARSWRSRRPYSSSGTGRCRPASWKLSKVMLEIHPSAIGSDILVCTTIIVESGIDIPTVNTMFINDAQRFGLGGAAPASRARRSLQAPRVLLLVHRAAGNVHAERGGGEERLKAIRGITAMHRRGVQAIAMRDLEIRGAGNILGTQQSGHIAMVGYELYCELLEHAVRRLKNLPPKVSVDVHVDLPVEAFIPRSYVPDMRAKIDLYRRLARVATPEELTDFCAELADRFGSPPALVRQLTDLAQLRVLAHHWGDLFDSYRRPIRRIRLQRRSANSAIGRQQRRGIADCGRSQRISSHRKRSYGYRIDLEFAQITVAAGLICRL